MLDNNFNKTIINSTDSRNLILESISPLYINILWLFVIVPMGILGSISNTICLIVFSKKEFKKNESYIYLKIYTSVSLLITINLCFLFLNVPHFFFSIATSFYSKIFRCLIIPSFGIRLLIFYHNCLIVLLMLERGSHLNPKLKFFKQLNPYILCPIVFLICFVMNSPSMFFFDLNNDSFACTPSSFSQTLSGKSFFLFIFIIEGPLILVLKIICIITTHRSMKNFFNKKLEIIGLNESEYLKDNENVKTKTKMIIDADKKITLFIIYITSFSIIFQCFLFAFQLCIFIINMDYSFTISSLHATIMFLVAFNNCSPIIIYSCLNNIFRKNLIDLICKCNFK